MAGEDAGALGTAVRVFVVTVVLCLLAAWLWPAGSDDGGDANARAAAAVSG